MVRLTLPSGMKYAREIGVRHGWTQAAQTTRPIQGVRGNELQEGLQSAEHSKRRVRGKADLVVSGLQGIALVVPQPLWPLVILPPSTTTFSWEPGPPEGSSGFPSAWTSAQSLVMRGPATGDHWPQCQIAKR